MWINLKPNPKWGLLLRLLDPLCSITSPKINFTKSLPWCLFLTTRLVKKLARVCVFLWLTEREVLIVQPQWKYHIFFYQIFVSCLENLRKVVFLSLSSSVAGILMVFYICNSMDLLTIS